MNLAWSVEITATAEKHLKKLDKKWQALILDYLEDDVATLENPRSKGKGLLQDKKGLWRYRVVITALFVRLKKNRCSYWY